VRLLFRAASWNANFQSPSDLQAAEERCRALKCGWDAARERKRRQRQATHADRLDARAGLKEMFAPGNCAAGSKGRSVAISSREANEASDASLACSPSIRRGKAIRILVVDFMAIQARFCPEKDTS